MDFARFRHNWPYMKSTLVIGASGGIGRALGAAYSSSGFQLTPLSRSKDGFDLTDQASVDRALADLGPFDRVIVASGGLEVDGFGPEKTIRAIDADAMAAQFALNAIGPALVLRHAQRLLPRDRGAVIAVLSARVGSIGDNRLGGWISYRAAKAAVNQIIKTTSIELARSHKHAVCVALHPGTVQTDLSRKYLSRHPAVPAAEAAQNLLNVIENLTPADSGGFFDWAGKPVEY